jgi:hypothetical protein
MEQSMTMSMYSSITPDDYHNEEDVFGEDHRLLQKKFRRFFSVEGVV